MAKMQRLWGWVPEEAAGVERGLDGIGAGNDIAAAALALGGASREEVDGLLMDQRALIAEQRHHLQAQRLPAVLREMAKQVTAVKGYR